MVAWDLRWLRLLAVAVFSLGSALTFFRVVHGVLAARRVACASRAPRSLIAVLEKLVGKERCPELLVSRSHPIPIATGAFWPIILLPPLFAERERPDDCRSVLAHELAHIRNGDLWLLALDRWLLPLFWCIPCICACAVQFETTRSYSPMGLPCALQPHRLRRHARALGPPTGRRKAGAATGRHRRHLGPADLFVGADLAATARESNVGAASPGLPGGQPAVADRVPILLSTTSVGPDVPRPSDYVARLFEQQASPKTCPKCHAVTAVVPVSVEHVRYSLEQPAIAEVRQLGGLVKLERHGYLPFVTEVNLVSHFTEDGHRFRKSKAHR